MSSRITKNLQNIGGGSLTLGTTPAYANIDMASNSISNVNQINGQKFPTGPGSAGYFLSLSADGRTLYYVSGLGTVGQTGVTGPVGPVGGSAGQILYNNGGYPSAAGSSYLTFDSGSGLTTMRTANVVSNLNVGGDISGNFGCNSYTIASVQLSAGRISNDPGTSNTIGGWTLSQSSLCNLPNTFSVQSNGNISNSDSTSNSVGGITLSDGTISTLPTKISTIGGWVLGNYILSNGTNFNVQTNGNISNTNTSSNTIGGVILSNGKISNASTSSNSVGGSILSNSALGVGVAPGSYALNVSGSGFVSGTFNVSGALTAQGTLEVKGTSLSAGAASATFSSVTITNGLTLSSLLVIGTSTLSGAVTMSNSLTVGGTSISSGNAIISVSMGIVKTTLSVGQIVYVPDIETLSIINGTPVNISGTTNNIILGTSFLNTSAGSNVASVGTGGASNNTGSFVNALGYYAGSSNTYSNCTFIGSNPNIVITYTPSSGSTIIANLGPVVDDNTGLDWQEFIVAGNDGNIYCAVRGGYQNYPPGNSIFRVSPSGSISLGTPYGTYTTLTSELINAPGGMIQAADASDSLYIQNSGNGKIVKFSQTTGTFSLMYGGINPPMDYYTSLLAQSTLTCNFYFANRAGGVHIIQKVDFTTGITTTLSSYPSAIRAITYASDDYLYMSDTLGDLYKIHPSSGTSTVVGNYNPIPGSLYGGISGYIYITYSNDPTKRVSLSDYTSTIVFSASVSSITRGPNEVFYGIKRNSRILVFGTPNNTYLPGISQANTLAVYSTQFGVNTIHADISNNYVGIGRAPGDYALDVSGTTRTTNLIVTGTSTLSGNVTISGLLSLSALNVLNAVNISGLLTVSAVAIQNNLTVGGTTISAGSAVTTVSAATIQNNLTVGGTTISAGSAVTTVSAATIQNNLTVGGTSISAGSVVATVSALNVLNAINISGLATVSGSTVRNNLTVQGTTLSAGSTLLTVSGAVIRTTLSVGQIAYIPDLENLSIINGTPVNISRGTGNIILGTSYPNTATGSNIVSVGNSAVLGNTGSYVNAFGYYAGSANSGSYVNTLGFRAGSSNTYSNCTFIGSNPNVVYNNNSPTAIANLSTAIGGINPGPGFPTKQCIIFGNDGNIYSAVNSGGYFGTGSNSIYRIPPTSIITYSSFTTLTSSLISLPGDIIQAADDPNSLYILNTTGPNAGKIVKFSQTTGTFTLMYGGTNPPYDYNATGLAQSTLTCNFYITARSSGDDYGIKRVNYATGLTTMITTVSSYLFTVKYNPSDNFLYTTANDGNLYRVNPSDGTTTLLGNYTFNFSNAVSLFIESGPGFIYLPINNQSVLKVSLSSYTSTVFSTSPINTLTQDPDGTFYSGTNVLDIKSYAGVYLPGVSQANTFALYSTVSGVNTIQADTSNNYVGIGRAPGAYSLDVSGTTRTSNLIITGALTMSGSLTIPDALSLTSLLVSNAANISGLLTVSSVFVQNNLTVSGLTTLSATTTTTLSATSLRTSTLLGITSINTMPTTINSVSDNFLIGNASGPYVVPTGTFVSAIGRAAALGSTGNNIVGLGYFASASATGTHINAIGYQAGFSGTADYQNAIGYLAGKNSTAINLTAIGYTAGENNKGTSNIALGDFAGSNQTGSSNVALGLRTLVNNSGSLTVGIGYNAGVSASANGCIYIGQRAGAFNTYANSIFLGSNPGYSLGADNQFVVYSLSSTLPLIQGDLSYNRVGIGKAPGAYALDVSGTIQTNDISLVRLNGVLWPSGTPGGSNYVPTYSNGAVSWLPGGGGGGGGSAWSSYPATQQVNLSGFDLAGVVSINSISAVFVSASSQIGLGPSVLSGNSGSNVIALGSNAGSGGTQTNVVYLGNNPGYDPASNDTFVVYSTNAGLPLIQGNLVSRSVGIGRVPQANNALDVSGKISATSIVTAAGSSNTLGPITTTTDSLVLIGNPTPNPQYKLDVNGTFHTSNIIANGGGGSNSIGGITLQNSTLSADTVVTPTLSNVSLLNGWQVSTSTVSGNFNIGTLLTTKLSNAVSIGPGAATNASGANIVAFGNSAGAGSLGNGVNAMGSYAANTNTGSEVNAFGSRAAYSNSGSNVNVIGISGAYSNSGNYVNSLGSESTLSNTGSYVNAVGEQAAYRNGGNYVNALGLSAGYFNSGFYLNAFGNQTGYRNGGDHLNAVGYQAGYSNQTNYVNALGYRAAYSNNGDHVNALGYQAAYSNLGVYVNALGYNAGLSNLQDSCTFIGKNPNPSSSGATAPNTFLVYSTSASAPTIQADTSNNRVGIGRVPDGYTLDVAGPIRTTSNIVNTINVTVVSSSTLTLATTNYSTYFHLVYTGGSTLTISLPGSLPIQGSYWVLKNNSTVNYTLNFTGGTLNISGPGAPMSMYLQAGNGVTLIYSGATSVYYTF